MLKSYFEKIPLKKSESLTSAQFYSNNYNPYRNQQLLNLIQDLFPSHHKILLKLFTRKSFTI